MENCVITGEKGGGTTNTELDTSLGKGILCKPENLSPTVEESVKVADTSEVS